MGSQSGEILQGGLFYLPGKPTKKFQRQISAPCKFRKKFRKLRFKFRDFFRKLTFTTEKGGAKDNVTRQRNANYPPLGRYWARHFEIYNLPDVRPGQAHRLELQATCQAFGVLEGNLQRSWRLLTYQDELRPLMWGLLTHFRKTRKVRMMPHQTDSPVQIKSKGFKTEGVFARNFLKQLNHPTVIAENS